MQARTRYTQAVDLLEQMLKQDYCNTDHTAINEKTMDGFVHCVCGLMKSAFELGYKGDNEPYYIAELKATGTPLASITAAVLEMSYTEGSKARG